MSDIELMELAAKAAGYEVELNDNAGYQRLLIKSHGRQGGVYKKEWDPLDNDADAMRLAVRLKLDMTFGPDPAVEVTNGKTEDDLVYRWEDTAADIYAATRRAIVKTAAGTHQSES